MSLPRFFASQIREGKELVLDPEEAHHLREVRRLSPGEEVRLIDGQGREFAARILRVSRREVAVLPETLLRTEPEPVFRLEFLLPLLKGGRTEFLVEKATELGVTHIFPFVSLRAVVRPSERTLERLRRRAVQALKQSGRLRLPEIHPPGELPEVLSRISAGHRGFAYEGGGESLRLFLKEFPREMALASGSEGGFSAEEAALLREAGFRPLSLGPYILRAETAALFLMVAWRYETLEGSKSR
ncbi:16S rRNA (uracil(1498)-N(3))-methyltransferase [Thermosulfurimonas marina]|uniref:Ribosomal RNA small subunit methyltransferase E n=1 Tax=Thermosulfurimonas marina TaxID=2047767 RepID=A0A6H1WR36_9BACT|nr:RsmE family RNA methyltransferase [Thermosulfurimonas marina]QJA05653.1 16S rRNA (uracil(1498)-N(3))-methyltransferase [Thermosulfurimonas marina]